jgi:hypothetical protein
VSGQCHAPAAFYPRGKDPYYLDRTLGGPQSWSGHRGYRNDRLPLPGSNPGRPVCSQTLYILTELPQLRVWPLYYSFIEPVSFRPVAIYVSIDLKSNFRSLSLVKRRSSQLTPVSEPEGSTPSIPSLTIDTILKLLHS